MSSRGPVLKKSISFTVEKDLAKRLSFLRNFSHRLTDFNQDIEKMLFDFCTSMENRVGITSSTWMGSRACPLCETGVLVSRTKKNEQNPSFMGCSKFPQCRHTESLIEMKIKTIKTKDAQDKKINNK